MRPLLLPLALLAVVAVASGCGASQTPAVSACKGLPHPTHSRSFLGLFGALNHLTKRDVCAHFGAPTSVTRQRGGREIWRYGPGPSSFTFKGNYGVATYSGR